MRHSAALVFRPDARPRTLLIRVLRGLGLASRRTIGEARPEGVARTGGRAVRRGRLGGSPIRLALAAASLLGLIYGGLALFRIHSASSAAPAQIALSEARDGAARLDSAAAALRAALSAASVSRRRFGGDPLDAAETALAGAVGLAQG